MIPQEIIPESITNTLKSENWQMIIVGSDYKPASDEVNSQIEKISSIIKNYDESGMVIGEAAATKDLISITDHDFQVVNYLYCIEVNFSADNSCCSY